MVSVTNFVNDHMTYEIERSTGNETTFRKKPEKRSRKSDENIKCYDDLGSSTPTSKKSIHLFDESKELYSDKGESLPPVLAESVSGLSEIAEIEQKRKSSTN